MTLKLLIGTQSARIFLETEDVRQGCDVLFDKRCSVVPFTVSSTSTATSSKLSTVEYLAIEKLETPSHNQWFTILPISAKQIQKF